MRGLNLKSFRKVGGDDDHSLMQHEHGHQIKILHKPLSPKMKKELMGLAMAQGGEVKQPKAEPSKGPYIDPDAAKGVEKGATEQGTGLVEGWHNIKKELGFSKGGAVQAYAEGTPDAPVQDIELADAPQALPARPDLLQDSFASKYADAPPEAPPLFSAAPMNRQAGVMSIPEASPVPSLDAAPVPQTPPVAVTAPAAASDPWGIKTTEDYLKRGIGQEISGNQMAAKAAAAEGKAEAEARLKQQASMDKVVAHYDAQVAELDKERKSLQQDIVNKHIDPNHYLGSMDTGARVSTTIGLMLGGLGAGLAGGPNQAMDFVNKQIDRDIDAQKAEIGKKETLLSANLKQYGNLHDAMSMTRMQMNDTLANMIGTASAQSKGPMAQAVAQMNIGKINKDNAQLMGQMARRRTLMIGSAAVTDPAVLVPMTGAPEHEQATMLKEIERAQNTRHMGDSILKSFDEAVKDNTVLKTGAGLLRTPASVYALHQSMQPTFQDLEGTVRQAAMDNTFKNITPAPGDSTSTIKTKRQALAEYLQSKKSAPTAKAYGLDLEHYPTTTTERPKGPEIRTMNGVQYQKVQGGWAKVK